VVWKPREPPPLYESLVSLNAGHNPLRISAR